MSKKVLGIDLGGTSAKMAIITTEGQIEGQWRISTDTSNNGENIIKDIIASIKENFKKHQIKQDDLLAIGMGAPGVVDFQEGTVTGAFNLNWKHTEEVKKQITEAFDLPFFIDNDANVAALGEKWLGAGNDDDNIVFLTLGTGVGGGIIANGKLIHGVAGSGGEVGHITVEPDGFQCTCGKKGCLETVASATGIANLIVHFAKKETAPSRMKTILEEGKEVSAERVFDLAKEGDVFAVKIVDEFAYYLGLACSHLGNILNPKYIVIGGGISNTGEFLLEKVRQNFVQFSFPNVKETTTIKVAELGSDAGVLGAVYLALIDSQQ